MPRNRSKSEERKRIQRLNLAEEQRNKIKQKDAVYQREKLDSITKEERQERN